MASMNSLNEVFNSFLLVYAALFPIINPIGGAPIFLGFTRHCTDRERHLLARRVAINGFILLLGSLLAGSHVLEFFGITIPVLRIAGGLVVTSFAWNLLQRGQEADDSDSATRAVGPNDAFYPLTMPLTIGPGSMSVAITLGSQRPKGITDFASLAGIGGGAIAGLLAVAFTVYLCYRFAERIVSALGENGANVLIRLSAFILVCIGIQILWNGISSLPSIPTH
jgi:multiple antibiotic resistance protein